MRMPACIAMLLSLAALAQANEPDPAHEFAAAIGRLSTNRCHMGNCGRYIIDRAEPIFYYEGDRNQPVYLIAGRAWDESWKADRDYTQKPDSVSDKRAFAYFVLCSKTRPALWIYHRDKKRWVGTALFPGDDTDESYGYRQSSYLNYFAACHRRGTTNENYSGLARKLGYNFKDGDADVLNEKGDWAESVSPFDLPRVRH